ncbi:MAG: hypothetical protein IJD38_13225, partial [Clostridia bacterium]|nr:hypothetical protein [Clostridia bacterium]
VLAILPPFRFSEPYGVLSGRVQKTPIKHIIKAICDEILNEYGKKYKFTDYLPNFKAPAAKAGDFGWTAMFFKVYGNANGAH